MWISQRRLPFLSLFLVLSLGQSTPAQDSKSDWSKVQTVKPGSKLVVKTKTGQKIEGTVNAVTTDSMTLSRKTPGQNVVIKRDEILEIRKKSGSYTATTAAVLGAVGAGGGYLTGYAIGESKNSRFRPEYPIAAVGAAAGAAIGALIGSRGHVIYKVR